jgi:hypothetical protein
MKHIRCLVIYGTGTRVLRIAVHAQELIGMRGLRIALHAQELTGTRDLRIAVDAQEPIFLAVSFRTRLTSIRFHLVSVGVLIKGFLHCRILPVV